MDLSNSIEKGEWMHTFAFYNAPTGRVPVPQVVATNEAQMVLPLNTQFAHEHQTWELPVVNLLEIGHAIFVFFS